MGASLANSWALRRGSVEKAIGYMRNELSWRKYPNYYWLSFLMAGSGDFDGAYSSYETAFNQSFKQVDPFRLEKDGNWTRFLVMTQVAQGENYYTRYPTNFQENINKWTQYILTKGELGLSESLSAKEIFASKSFQMLKEFDQARILFRLREKAEKGGKLTYSELIEAIRADSTARRVYSRFSDMPAWW